MKLLCIATIFLGSVSQALSSFLPFHEEHSHVTIFHEVPLGPHLDLGHPQGTHDFVVSSGKSAHSEDDGKYADAVHAGRFGVELNKLARSNKDAHDEYIASGYSPRFRGSLPRRLKELATSHPSFSGRAPVLPSSTGDDFSFSEDIDFDDFGDFPEIFHGDRIFENTRFGGRRRNGKFTFPPKETGKVVTFKW